MTRSAAEIHELSSVDPERALSMAETFLDSADSVSWGERAVVLRGMSVAKRLLGRFEDAIDLAGRARRLAQEAGDAEQEILAVVTMVGPMVVLGRTADAMALIDGSADFARTPYLEARLTYQRGVVLQMKGEPGVSIEAFEAALPAFRESHDLAMTKSALQGLGLQRLVTGDLDGAESALSEALAIAEERGEEPSVSGIKHNLGLVAAYRGDITGALALLLDSEDIYMRLTGSPAPQHVARCEALISAGLFREARALADEIAKHRRDSGDPEHMANALLVGARAALLGGQFDDAKDTAEEAAAAYESRGRSGEAVDARWIACEARFEIEGPSTDLFRTASEIADVLARENKVAAAAQARLLVGRIAIGLGDDKGAVTALRPVSGVKSGPIELRLQSRVARARLRRLQGDMRGSDAAARSGLGLIDVYQAALGATDLRMGLERHGRELGSIGLGLALDSGKPRRILAWMERTRARALRHRPVVATNDDRIRQKLGRLRQVEAGLRDPTESSEPQLRRERRRLQEEVRFADRLKQADEGTVSDFTVLALVELLADRTLVEIGVHDGHLVGVAVRRGRAGRVELGEAAPMLDELRHVRFAMRRAARRGRPIDPASMSRLEEMLLGDLRIDTEGVVLVPPPSLMAVPWAALPRLRDLVLTVSPSAEMWWRAERRGKSGSGVVVAGGPDLEVAETEITAVGALYPDPTLLPPGATVEALRKSLANAATAHIASHATFQVENPMFSSLRFGDGDLNVYDIERLERPPSLVVLSACDSGYTEAGSGDELAGLTSALLSMGTRSVVASVGLVPDSLATSELMVAFHRGLLEGLDPPRALAIARARMGDEPEGHIAGASFVCVGA